MRQFWTNHRRRHGEVISVALLMPFARGSLRVRCPRIDVVICPHLRRERSPAHEIRQTDPRRKSCIDLTRLLRWRLPLEGLRSLNLIPPIRSL